MFPISTCYCPPKIRGIDENNFPHFGVTQILGLEKRYNYYYVINIHPSKDQPKDHLEDAPKCFNNNSY